MISHPNRSKAGRSAKTATITREVAQRVLEIVDAGLVRGLGSPEPGKVCVEAAVCLALGEPHGDNPSCVSHVLRALKIRLNDSAWSSDQARAKGLRRLAIAQLGSAGFLDESEFIARVMGVVIRKAFPVALKAVAAVTKDEGRKAKWLDLAARCEAAPEQIKPREARQFFLELKQNADAATYAADAAADAAAYAAAYAAADAAAYAARWRLKSVARDRSLAAFCEEVVQVLIAMGAPGCQWLDLAEAA